MSGAFILKTVLEIAAVILIVVGFIYEEKVIAFENKVVRLVAYLIRRRRRRKMAALRLEQQRLQQRRLRHQRAAQNNNCSGNNRPVKKTPKRVA
ncbi:MAG: hypothetical protein GX824_05310 [Clostridiales bacterium]|jgi:hypothetical protein|nr:hypothetical protein [Clostridiales bacterium]